MLDRRLELPLREGVPSAPHPISHVLGNQCGSGFKSGESGLGSYPAGLIWTSVHDKYSASTKITSQLDHVSHCELASGTNWSDGGTLGVSTTNTNRD